MFINPEFLFLTDIRSIDGDTPAGIACVLRLQAQAMPAAREQNNTKYVNEVLFLKELFKSLK